MLSNIIDALYFILPVVLAGLLFIVTLKKKWLNGLKTPLDYRLRISGKRLFGRNKTWLGLIMMSCGTVLFTIVISLVTSLSESIPLYELSSANLIAIWLVGAGYSLGELPNSFIKRQLGIEPGERAEKGLKRAFFTLLDNIDSVLGSATVAFFIYTISVPVYIWMLILGSAIHLSTDLLMRKISLK